MKQLSKYIITLVVTLWGILLPGMCSGQRYHVDPNEPISGDARMPTKKEAADGDKVIIKNNYSSAVTLLTSSDNKKWDTVQVKQKNFVLSKQKTLYVKVYTTAENYKLYQLYAGTTYQLFWNKDEQFWQIVK